MTLHIPPRGEDGSPDLLHHRNRLAGLWAAELLGLIGHAAQDYAQNFTKSLNHDPARPAPPHDTEWLVARLARDLSGYASISDIRERLEHFMGEARALLHKRPH